MKTISSAKDSVPSTSTSTTLTDIEDLCEKYGFESASQRRQVHPIQTKLLEWYDTNGRVLPWRKNINVEESTEEELQQRAYEVWVSEVMAQQTRLATVTEYYLRWMEKFPTVAHLADSNINTVNSMWSGLGYYRRARMLFEGAKKVVQMAKEVEGGEGDGKKRIASRIPHTAKELEKLPGIGAYTAGAIASIVFDQQVPVVDGNVMRVLARLRCIPLPINQSQTVKIFWRISETLLQRYDDVGDNGNNVVKSPANGQGQLGINGRYGDFNQAMMELGALVCAPKSPKCGECPLADHCRAYESQEQHRKSPKRGKSSSSITSVEQLPMKDKKKAPREETVAAIVFRRKSDNRYLFTRRPETGLLANLWEFPSIVMDPNDGDDAEEDTSGQFNQAQLLAALSKYCLETNKDVLAHLEPHSQDMAEGLFHPSNAKFCGKVEHIFTHIRQTLNVFSVDLPESDAKGTLREVDRDTKCMWMSKKESDTNALPTVTKKVMKQCRSSLQFPVMASTGKRSRAIITTKKSVATKKKVQRTSEIQK